MYKPDQIDDANLAYHYNVIVDNASGGVYYQLKSGAEGFPQSFWASERSPSVSSSAVSTASDYRAKNVATFRIVAHTMGPLVNGGAVSQNHWTIYLLVPGGSVQLNMKTNTDPISRRGIFEIRERAYVQSNTTVRFFDFPAALGVTVDYVEREITYQGWDKYDMHEGGVGCRWWILSVMRGLAKKHYVDGNKVESELLDALSYNYSRNLEPIWLEMKKGEF